jgi:DNA-binding MurR/RpiR family transcriptional regulator
VRQRLNDCLARATPAEKTLATYILSNLNEIPFETAASLAAKVALSELTVGRFCRSIGYRHFKELKADLKADIGDKPWLIGDRLREFQARSRSDKDALARSLELEIAALVKVYEMARSPEWRRAVKRLAAKRRVFVVGFQTERGIAAAMVQQLQYLRDGVQLLDLTAGNFAELFLTDTRECCLVVFEARRYSRLAKLLCRKAHEARIPVTLVTDYFCGWGRDYATELFAVPTELNLFWDSTAPMFSLVNLMVNSVFNELEPSVEQRLNNVAELYGAFIGHADSPSGPDH